MPADGRWDLSRRLKGSSVLCLFSLIFCYMGAAFEL